MQYGSALNHLMSKSKATEPEVGMGATILLWSDRHAATITAVVRFQTGERRGKVRYIIVQEDIATRIDQNGMSESQQYTYTPNPNGRTQKLYATKDGRFEHLLVGHRDQYYDYSF